MTREHERGREASPSVVKTSARAVGIVAVVGAVLLVGLWRYAWAETVRPDWRVAALIFHSVTPDPHGPTRYTMREGDFTPPPMRGLRELGVEAIDLDAMLACIEGRQASPDAPCPYPEGAVLVTFDTDGASYHTETVVGLLKDLDIPALFFVPTGYIGLGRGVTTAAIRALAGLGFAFGSHTQWHRDMRPVEPDELEGSLAQSRTTLRELTGQTVRSIASPGGPYDEGVITTVQAAGLSGFFNSDSCPLTERRTRFRICRIEIRGDRGMRAMDGRNPAEKGRDPGHLLAADARGGSSDRRPGLAVSPAHPAGALSRIAAFFLPSPSLLGATRSLKGEVHS